MANCPEASLRSGLFAEFHLRVNAVLRAVFTRGVDDVRRGRWDLSRDGSLYSLPVGSPDVLIGKVAD